MKTTVVLALSGMAALTAAQYGAQGQHGFEAGGNPAVGGDAMCLYCERDVATPVPTTLETRTRNPTMAYVTLASTTHEIHLPVSHHPTVVHPGVIPEPSDVFIDDIRAVFQEAPGALAAREEASAAEVAEDATSAWDRNQPHTKHPGSGIPIQMGTPCKPWKDHNNGCDNKMAAREADEEATGVTDARVPEQVAEDVAEASHALDPREPKEATSTWALNQPHTNHPGAGTMEHMADPYWGKEMEWTPKPRDVRPRETGAAQA